MIRETADALHLENERALTVGELAELSGLAEAVLRELIDYGAIEPLDPRAVTWTFSAQVILRARTASRLQRDFDLDAHALSVVLRFLERVEALEAQVRALRAQRTR